MRSGSNATRWRLPSPGATASAATYRALGDSLAYTRRQEFDPLRQEQMVLQHIDTYGEIRRREVSDLCQIDSDEARNLLARLLRRGQVARRGEGRSSYYVPSTDEDAPPEVNGP